MVENKKIVFCGKNFSKFQNIIFKENPNQELYYCPLIYSKKIMSKLDEEKIYNKMYDYVVVTSQEVFSYIKINKIQTKNWFAVGCETAKKIKFLNKSFPEDAYTSDSLIKELIKLPEKHLNILWLTGKNLKRKITNIRKKHSLLLLQIYQNCNINKKKLKGYLKELPIKQKLYWIFTSASCVRSYFYHNLFDPVHVLVCIGPETAKRFQYYNIKPHLISKKNTLQGVSHAICAY